MESTRRQIVDDLIHDAHHGKDRIVASEIAAEVVADLRNLEAEGHRWVSELIDRLLLAGAAKMCADWRRRYSHSGRTKKGTEVEIPKWGAVIEADDAGAPVHVQLALFTMTLDQARAKRDALVKGRDTLSAEIRWYSDVIEIMEADPALRTVGDALARLEAA